MFVNLKRNNWIAMVAIGLVAALYIFFGFVPMQRMISAREEELEKRRLFISEGDELQLRLEKLQKKLQNDASYTEKWTANAPSSQRLPDLIYKIHQLTARSGANVTGFERKPIETLQSIKKVPIGLTVDGSFAEIARLLLWLERLPPTIWFDKLRLSKVDNEGESIRFEVDLVIFADKNEISD